MKSPVIHVHRCGVATRRLQYRPWKGAWSPQPGRRKVSDQTSPEGEHPPSSEDLRLAYEQVHNRYAGITDFRAKLLGLLPLVTGTSAFLLLAQVKDPDSNLRKFLGPMGILGLVVTLGLFIYELRGM
jgi:hypothetical protein